MRAVAQRLYINVIMADLEGTITYCNDGASKLFGCGAEEMLGCTLASLGPDPAQAAPQSIRPLGSTNDQVTATGSSHRTTGVLIKNLADYKAGDDPAGEWRARRKDGTPVWINITATRHRDPHGLNSGYICLVRDITVQMRIEERNRLLTASTEALATALDPRGTPQRIAELAVPIFADWCSVGTLEEDGGVFWLGMAHRDASLCAELQRHGQWIGLRLPASAHGVFRAALQTKRTQLVTRLSEAQLQAKARGDAAYLNFLRAFGPISLVAVPLTARGRLVGVIEYITLGADRAYTRTELPALEDLARRAALALDLVRWHDEALRARAAAEARARELEATFEAMADGVIVFDQNARIVQINRAARALFAMDALHAYASLQYEEIARLIRVRDATGRLLPSEDLVPKRVLRGEMLTGERGVTIHITALDGRERVLDVSGAPLLDASETVVGAVVTYRDVTEQYMAERALRLQDALLALAQDAIIERAPNGIILRWNAGAAALYGWSAAEAVGQVTHTLLRTRVLATGSRAGIVTAQDVDAIIAAAGAWEGTLEHTRRDGARLVVESRQALVRDEAGRPVAILEINRDITAREAFVSSLAHDLKTPLTGILGHAQLAARHLDRIASQVTEPVNIHVGRIGVATRSLARMIDELVDVTRLRVGAALELQRQPADLVAVVRAVVAQQEGLTGHHLIVEATVPAVEALVDAPRLERVLGNLLSNAIKYSLEASDVMVQIALADGERGPGVTIAVQDRGVGIPAEDLYRIFEPFHRARNVVGVVPGTGLGLAGARAIVEQHGGTIGVESIEGAGTTVWIWLPRTSCDA
jgi:PAS domain S-box-containing protein